MKKPLFVVAFIVAILSFVVIAGCSQGSKTVENGNPEPTKTMKTVELGKEFGLKQGETAFIKSENIGMVFINITEDSRCPSGSQCVWAGEAVALVEVKHADKKVRDFQVVEGRSVSFDSPARLTYVMKLVQVKPYPEEGKRIGQSDYTIFLEVHEAKAELLG